MRRSAAGLSALLSFALLTAATGAFAVGPDAAPKVEKTFLIPSGEGYGVGECLTDGSSECGRVVADAWCEAQGFASAGTFGVAAQDEYTGAIETAPAVKVAERPIRITCQD